MQPDSVQKDAVELLKAMVAIPSVSSHEEAVADFLQDRLETWFGGKVSRNGHSLIVDIKGASDGPTLLLCTHIDTVPPAAGWTKKPYAATVEGEKIYGLGANDAGASVVSMIAAARLVTPPVKGRLLLCLAAEEEAGSQGFIRVEPELVRYDAAIFGEPTDMGMASSMRGAMKVMMRSHGVACHASRPWEGKNAVDAFVSDIKTLRCLDLKDNSLWGQATVEPTMIRGGQSPNQIPDLIETTLDIRTTPEKNNDWIEEQLKKTGIDYSIIVNRRRPMLNDAASRLVAAIKSSGANVPDYTFNGTCDMAFAKAPSIVMGPGKSNRSHVADEYIEVTEIEAAIPIYRKVIEAYLA
jgi:acetylornithine deacetylase